jgi:hypothetical protein
LLTSPFLEKICSRLSGAAAKPVNWRVCWDKIKSAAHNGTALSIKLVNEL